MVDVFDQVEEELRSDRYKRLARTWLPVVLGILVIALVAALGLYGWERMETGKANKASLAFQRGLESLQANNPIGADAAFTQAAKEGNAVYKAAALNYRAAIAVQDNRDPDAVRLYDEAAKSARDPLMADAATLKATWLLMDTAPLADIQKRLEPLMKEGRPLRPFAQEAMALANLQHGKIAEARSTLVILKNGLDTPQIVGQRVTAALDSIDNGTAANLQLIVEQQKRLEEATRAAQAGAAGNARQGAPASPQSTPANP